VAALEGRGLLKLAEPKRQAFAGARYPDQMLIGIDHVVIAVADPDEAATQLEREVGLKATGGGQHEALGTFNRLIWLGDTYLELVGVFERTLAEQSWLGIPTLQALGRSGGLATWAIATDSLAVDLTRLRVLGSDLSEPIAGERRREDGAVIRWRLARPPRLAPTEPPFLIEHDVTGGEWTPSERAARLTFAHPLGRPARLEGLELAVDDVNRTSQRCGRTVGLQFRPSLVGGGSRDADIGVHFLRLRPRRGGPVSAVIRLAAPIPEERTAHLLGCRWIVRPAGTG
jgi:hypothetical protein